ncbi:MAG TPA: DoxX family protein [Steroidobacteraceae bacterium]|jgi:putative oxidoreductase|nr:DoxX family protein [Steroidobacteraceae bacterium]
MGIFVDALIEWPRRVAGHIAWLGPLFARLVTGWVFVGTGWGKLTHLPLVTENFANWGIPAPGILAPFVSGVEFVGGIFLLAGFLTRICAGALGVVMVVAVKAAQWESVESFGDLLGLEEVMYLALFLWLAIAGAGRVSLDRLMERDGRG